MAWLRPLNNMNKYNVDVTVLFFEKASEVWEYTMNSILSTSFWSFSRTDLNENGKMLPTRVLTAESVIECLTWLSDQFPCNKCVDQWKQHATAVEADRYPFRCWNGFFLQCWLLFSHPALSKSIVWRRMMLFKKLACQFFHRWWSLKWKQPTSRNDQV